MADDILQRLGAAAMGKLPAALQRGMGNTIFRTEGGPTQSIASGSQIGNLAGVIPGQNVVNVMDPAAFQKAPDQLAAHEGTHIWQNNLPPTLAAKIPADNAQDPYGFGGLAGLNALRQRGGTILDLPKEQQAAMMQYRQSQGGDNAPQAVRKATDPFVQDMNNLPLSVILPTDPDQKGINTNPRAPVPPVQAMMMSQKTYAKGQPADPPPPAGYTVDSDPAPPAGYTVDAPQTPAAPPGNTLSAAPAPSWGQQATEDLQQGGNRTVVGRTLGFLQGRGGQGYTGLESGVSPAAADYVGSPFLGAARTVAGVQEIPEHPVQGALDTGKGLFQAATLPMTFMGGPVADAGIQSIPSKAAAGKMFQSVMADAGDVPVNLNNASQPLLRAQEISARGASMPQAAGKLLRRATQPGAPPITYGEARDFASNISSLSANDAMKMTGPMKSTINNLRSAFHRDIGDAAETVGRGADYRSALQEYASAMRLRDNAQTAGLWALKKGLPMAGGAGAAAYEAHKLFR
jgi:hypothetical protein